MTLTCRMMIDLWKEANPEGILPTPHPGDFQDHLWKYLKEEAESLTCQECSLIDLRRRKINKKSSVILFFSKKQINFKGERIEGKSDLPRTNDYIREVIGKRCDNSQKLRFAVFIQMDLEACFPRILKKELSFL